MTKKTHLYYEYLEEFKEYILLTFEKDDSDIPKYLYLDSLEDELILDESFFIFYKDGKPYYFQKLKKDYDKDELIKFIKNRFNIDKLKVSDFKEKNLNKSKIKDLQLIKIKQSNSFKFYLLYLICLISIFLIFENRGLNQNRLKNINSEISYIKNENKFIYLSKKLLELNQKASTANITIVSYLLKNSKISIRFQSKNKTTIYQFLRNYKNSSVESIDFDKDKKEYITNAIFRIY